MRLRRRPDDRPPLSEADRLARAAWVMSALLAMLIAALAAAHFLPATPHAAPHRAASPTTSTR